MLGVIINVCAVALGGVAGALFGRKIPEEIKAHLNAIFGICAMAMGINTIVLMENMPAVLYLLADFIYPLTTPAMINDFKACGGILLIAMGFRMLKLRIFPVADMIIAMILVMPCSCLWAQYVVPLL